MLSVSSVKKKELFAGSKKSKNNSLQDTKEQCLNVNYSELSDMSYSLTMASTSFDSEERTSYDFSQASSSLATTQISSVSSALMAPFEIILETRQEEPNPPIQRRSLPSKPSSSSKSKSTSRAGFEQNVKKSKFKKKVNLNPLKTFSSLTLKSKQQEVQKHKDCVKKCNQSNINELTKKSPSKSLRTHFKSLPKKPQQKEIQVEHKYKDIHQVADSYATKLTKLMNEYHHQIKMVEEERESPPTSLKASKTKTSSTKNKASKNKQNQQQHHRKKCYNHVSLKSKKKLSWWDETASLSEL